MSDQLETQGRQTAWQKNRASLSWPEKIRAAAAVRKSVIELRRTAPRRVRPEVAAEPALPEFPGT